MLDRLMQDPKFKHLEGYIDMLLAKVEKSLPNDSATFFIYIAFLIVTENYRTSVSTIDKNLQQLIASVQKYWKGPVDSSTDDNRKRDIIKLIMLNKLSETLEKNKPLRKKNRELKAFVNTNKEVFLKKINTNNVENIFTHNMDFLLPSAPPVYSQTMNPIVEWGSTSIVFFMFYYLSKHLVINYQYDKFAQYDFNRDQLSTTQRFLTSLAMLQLCLLIGYVAANINYTLVTKATDYMHRLSVTDFQQLDILVFKNFCIEQDEQLRALIKERIVIDQLWMRPSRFVRPGKSPYLLKLYVQSELVRLDNELQNKDLLIKLLTCSLVEAPTHLSDLPYTPAIEILRRPLTYWRMPNQSQETRIWVECYIKLAYIDFINKEIREKPLFKTQPQSDAFNNLLNQISQYLKSSLAVIEAKPGRHFEFLNTFKGPLADLSILAMVIFGYDLNLDQITRVYKSSYTQEDNMLAEITSPSGALIHLLKTFLGGPPIFNALLYKTLLPALVTKMMDSATSLQDKMSSQTMFFYTRQALIKHPELREIFEERPLIQSKK